MVAFTVNSAGSAATRAAATDPRRSRLDRTSKVGEGEPGPLRPPYEQDGLFQVEAQTVHSPSSGAGGGGGGGDALVAAQEKRSPQAEEEEEEEDRVRGQEEGYEKREFLPSVLLSADKGADLEGGGEQRHSGRQPGETADLPHHPREGRGGGGKLPSVALVGLLVLFFFLYVGIEVGFGAWVAVVVLRDSLAGEAGAALMAR